MFDYLLKKIKNAEFRDFPYRHIYIEDFFSNSDFNKIVKGTQINLPAADSIEELIEILKDNGWTPRPFGGCTINEKAYIRWRNKKETGYENVDTCSGFGMAYDLLEPESEWLRDLRSFLRSEYFFFAIAEVFGIPSQPFRIAAGCHKYLSGYEISPHPDSRNKALTYMININPNPKSEEESHHTHYMTLKRQYEYVSSYWQGNPEVDRSWLPWGWCNTEFKQNKNNSIVIFSPNDKTIHAINSNYDDLTYQRTQFYGNLWYEEYPKLPRPSWSSLEIVPENEVRKSSFIWKVRNKIDDASKAINEHFK